MAKPIRLRPKPEKVKKESTRPKPTWDIFTLYTKEERVELKNKTLSLYESGIGPTEIAGKLKVPLSYVQRTVKESPFRLGKSRAELIISDVEKLGLKMNETKSKVIVNCRCCGKEKLLTRAAFKKDYIDRQVTYICRECFEKEKSINGIPRQKTIRNKTGFVGIQFKIYPKYFGIVGNITKNGKILLNNYLHIDLDSDLDQGLLECAIKREIFIIENNYNLARNFTDEELVTTLEKVAMDNYNKKLSEIQKIKTTLGI